MDTYIGNHAIKINRAVRTPGAGGRGGDYILRTMPPELVAAMPARLIALAIRWADATYRDGYTAAGGDVCDSVSHCERHRAALQAE
jgi:hypothetical protein